MKGILLAIRGGSRLYPVTRVVPKPLLPVYEKPMVYYPLTTLMLAGIRDILLIAAPADLPQFTSLLDDGSKLGVSLSYAPQPQSDSAAKALLTAGKFVGAGRCALILGDTIFYGNELTGYLRRARESAAPATIFAYPVHDPERHAVVTLDTDGRPCALENKPRRPDSPYAVTGLYFYDSSAIGLASGLSPLADGTLEITEINRHYLAGGQLDVIVMGRGMAWLDTDTHESLLEASFFIQTVEKRQGLKIACPEEIAYRLGYIDAEQLERLAGSYSSNAYGRYLQALLKDRLTVAVRTAEQWRR